MPTHLSTLIFAAIKKLDTIYFRTPCKFETLLGHPEYSETPCIFLDTGILSDTPWDTYIYIVLTLNIDHIVLINCVTRSMLSFLELSSALPLYITHKLNPGEFRCTRRDVECSLPEVSSTLPLYIKTKTKPGICSAFSSLGLCSALPIYHTN